MTVSRDNTETYNAIIIGSGQSGNPLSVALAKANWKTAIIENQYVGGTCINFGCTPTKTMVASARIAYLARRAADYGVNTGPVSVDMAKVRARKQSIVESFRKGGQSRLENTDNLDLIFGKARFTDTHTVEVRLNDGGSRGLAADKIFINTGARPIKPAVPGLEGVPTLDSTTIMELDTLPDHLLVLGGGYVGLEFGQMFRRFGSNVTIIQKGTQLLAREDPDLADEIVKILKEDGIEIYLNTETLQTQQVEGGRIRLTIQTPSGEQKISGSHLLVATGREPNTAELNLAAVGIVTDKGGFIKVNERLETNVPGVYAIGDVKGGPAFTHISYDDFRILRTNLLEGGNATTTGRLLPYTVFIDPQLGRVGLTEREARAQGKEIRVAKLPMTRVARAIEVGESRGSIKAIVDAETDQILGCAVLGIEGGEIMSLLQMAIMGRISYTQIRDAIFAHPTLAESLNNLFMAMDA
jgi:pyruvate/2-oxoglutarate dehydrogenase complex dihydrolipoamide dehydrogenase (E3) component